MKKRVRIATRAGRVRLLPVLLAAGLLLCCLPLFAGAAAGEMILPEGFSFSESCLQIANYNTHINKGYYIDTFGPLKGYLIYLTFEEGGSHGICYGLAVANAALLNGTPAAEGFSHADGSAAANIGDLRKGTVDGTTSLPLMSMIRYGYVLQAGTETAINYEKTRNDAAGLRAAVSDFVYRGGPPVIVGLLGEYSSHEVLAVGLMGDEDIVIWDSNEPTRGFVMDFSGRSWRYSCAGQLWQSPYDSFDYGVSASLLYDDLTSAAGETVLPKNYTYTAQEEAKGSAVVRRSGMDPLDEDWLLMATDEDCIVSKNGTLKVGWGASPLKNDNRLDYFWTPKDTVASVYNNGNGLRTFLMADNNSGLLARVPSKGSAAVTFSGERPSVLITGKKGEHASVIRLKMTGEVMDSCVAEGVLDGKELYAVDAPAGFLVDGLKNLSVRFCRQGKDDSATKSFSFSRGMALIRGGYSGFTIDLMGDADGDGKLTPEDARLILRCSVALEDIARFDSDLCDYNADGEVTPEDARLILRRTVGLRD